MKLIAKCSILVDGKRVRPGQEFEAEENGAQNLIKRGFAVEAKAEKVAQPAPGALVPATETKDAPKPDTPPEHVAQPGPDLVPVPAAAPVAEKAETPAAKKGAGKA